MKTDTGSFQRCTIKGQEAVVTNVKTVWKSEKKISSPQEQLSTHTGVGDPVTSRIFSNFSAPGHEERGLTWQSALFSGEAWTRELQKSFPS